VLFILEVVQVEGQRRAPAICTTLIMPCGQRGGVRACRTGHRVIVVGRSNLVAARHRVCAVRRERGTRGRTVAAAEPSQLVIVHTPGVASCRRRAPPPTLVCFIACRRARLSTACCIPWFAGRIGRIAAGCSTHYTGTEVQSPSLKLLRFSRIVLNLKAQVASNLTVCRLNYKFQQRPDAVCTVPSKFESLYIKRGRVSVRTYVHVAYSRGSVLLRQDRRVTKSQAEGTIFGVVRAIQRHWQSSLQPSLPRSLQKGSFNCQ